MNVDVLFVIDTIKVQQKPIGNHLLQIDGSSTMFKQHPKHHFIVHLTMQEQSIIMEIQFIYVAVKVK